VVEEIGQCATAGEAEAEAEAEGVVGEILNALAKVAPFGWLRIPPVEAAEYEKEVTEGRVGGNGGGGVVCAVGRRKTIAW